MNFDYPESLFKELESLGFSGRAETIKKICDSKFSPEHHGDFLKWQAVLTQLPRISPSIIDINRADILVGESQDLNESEHEVLIEQFKKLHPWRKGPYNLFGQYIDTEWRSDWKWDRLGNELGPLTGRKVLDIGCGSGYHCWRMRGEGAQFVLGIDPTMLFVMQFFAIQHYIQDEHVNVLPISLEDIVGTPLNFDTVFSMGLLYHRRDPLVHLQELKQCLRVEGELVLETLVIEDQYGDVLIPEGRYAQMRNVWSIPSVSTLENWMMQAGFKDIRCIDVSATTVKEQRSTNWMTFQSLADFLDVDDHSKTIEGYPAPVRATFIATK
ncbi:tRNA (mo5U34)-methyltransferase [hydrothermal vent metagenome]|uniref:tRNA (Mo5U34)-methyltransferase n=1 Tax=hydrothermal vent metagenome TaxID=652676 RepID=A0A3B0ZX27_9ZZZZ